MAFQDYLPSKAFQKRLLAIVIIIAAILVIGFIVKLIGKGIDAYKINKQIKQLPAELRSQVDTLTLGDLQKKDSNGNGILDWEERLYGLDPLTNGEENKKTVEAKRQLLRDTAGENEASAATGLTNDFTREFLNVIGSLQTTGALSDDALQNIANSIGGKLINQDQKEIYPASSFKIIRDSSVANKEYQRLSNIELNKFNNIPLLGHEIEFIGESLRSADPLMLAPLDNISVAYKSFADSLIKVPVPESLLPAHKALVNSSAYVSRSLLMIQKINTDPMTALQGLAMYNTHFIIMNQALDELATNLNL